MYPKLLKTQLGAHRLSDSAGGIVQELERVEKVGIMTFEDAPSSRSVPVCADRGGRMDEPTAAVRDRVLSENSIALKMKPVRLGTTAHPTGPLLELDRKLQPL